MLHTNCLLKGVIEGRIERTKRRGKRRKSGYWLILRKLELLKEALDRTMCRTRF